MEKPRMSAGYWTRSNKRLEFFMDLLTLIVRPRDESPGPQCNARSLQAAGRVLQNSRALEAKVAKAQRAVLAPSPRRPPTVKWLLFVPCDWTRRAPRPQCPRWHPKDRPRSGKP